MDPQSIMPFVAHRWRESIVPVLSEYITIPNQSPAFDREWGAHGHMDRAVKLVSEWIAAQQLRGAALEILCLEGRTPLILVDVLSEQGTASPSETVLLYGHLDKQPPFTGWAE